MKNVPKLWMYGMAGVVGLVAIGAGLRALGVLGW